MTISIHRTEIPPSSTNIFIQSQSRDTCIRYNPVPSGDYAPRIRFKPLLWTLLIGLVGLFRNGVGTIEDAMEFPPVRREGKRRNNDNLTVADVALGLFEERNETDDVLFRDEYADDSIAEMGGNGTNASVANFDDGYRRHGSNDSVVSQQVATIHDEINGSSRPDAKSSDAAITAASNSTDALYSNNTAILENISNVDETVANTTISALSAGLLQKTTASADVANLTTLVTNDSSNRSNPSMDAAQTDERILESQEMSSAKLNEEGASRIPNQSVK